MGFGILALPFKALGPVGIAFPSVPCIAGVEPAKLRGPVGGMAPIRCVCGFVGEVAPEDEDEGPANEFCNALGPVGGALPDI